MEERIRETRSLCPVCLKTLPADIIGRDGAVYLERRCPEHGFFSAVIWRGRPEFKSWRRPKTPLFNGPRQSRALLGCPRDCGLCPEHGQPPCAVLFEITPNCNLRCPVCFADAGQGAAAPFPPLEELKRQLYWIREQAGPVVLQISGGEPTLYPRLPELVAEAARLFPAVQLNTNGLRLTEEAGLAKALAQAGLSWVFLQFDGVDDHVYETLRGRPLLAEKIEAVKAAGRAGLAVVLVPTVAAGVNDHQLGDLLDLALAHSPVVRGIHFQPMTSSGRNRLGDPSASRLTLPELLTSLGRQSKGRIDPELASPPGCEHERCSFHLRYRLRDGILTPLKSLDCCGGEAAEVRRAAPEETARSLTRSIETVIRSWSKPAIPMAAAKPADAFDEFIKRAREEIFSLTAMAFQDVWTMDLERLRGCCISVFHPSGRLMPFCAYNATSVEGHALHR